MEPSRATSPDDPAIDCGSDCWGCIKPIEGDLDQEEFQAMLRGLIKNERRVLDLLARRDSSGWSSGGPIRSRPCASLIRDDARPNRPLGSPFPPLCGSSGT
jgi:hypothetical protein